MKTYLLKAEDADMERWKADAHRHGRSFADHVRDALDVASGVPVLTVKNTAGGRAVAKVSPDPHFKPYPKPSQKKR